jgi:dihydrofolate reductase
MTTSARTQYYTASTLDGFIAGPDHTLDWLMQFGDVEGGDYVSFIADVGALVMGSSTYEWVLDNVIRDGAAHPGPWPYAQPTWVFTTRSLERVDGGNVRFASGPVAAVHAEMLNAAGGKNVWVVGGGDLAGQFHDAGLLDDIIVTIASVTLGAGYPLLPRRITTPPLRLLSAKQFGNDFVELRYEVQRPTHSRDESDA